MRLEAQLNHAFHVTVIHMGVDAKQPAEEIAHDLAKVLREGNILLCWEDRRVVELCLDPLQKQLAICRRGGQV